MFNDAHDNSKKIEYKYSANMLTIKQGESKEIIKVKSIERMDQRANAWEWFND